MDTLSWEKTIPGFHFPQNQTSVLQAGASYSLQPTLLQVLPLKALKEPILVIPQPIQWSTWTPLVQGHKVWKKSFPGQLPVPVTPMSEGNLAHSDRN